MQPHPARTRGPRPRLPRALPLALLAAAVADRAMASWPPPEPLPPPADAAGSGHAPGTGEDTIVRLKKLTLEQLMTLEISTVSKRPEQRLEAAAAIAVITSEDIRRAGVRHLPEALRLVPGVHVARIDANKWAVGIRGFANRFSRSVLVLIDGRSVYTPLFAGTYWEVQDTLLEDVERIEVIRGPGGSLWGANAFNGVINIITKNAADTQGELVEAGAGTEEKGFLSWRHGDTTDGDVAWRTYVKGFRVDSGWREDGEEYDDWGMAQAGARADWQVNERDSMTVQGDVYTGRTGQRADVITFAPPFLTVLEEDAKLGGGNALARWTRALKGGGEIRLQGYYDRTYRKEPTFREWRTTVDVDFQHRMARGGHHGVIWGAAYRLTGDDIDSSFDFLGAEPSHRQWHQASAFVEDQIRFHDDRMRLTFGTKIEKNDFTEIELQPNVRFAWTPDVPQQLVVWGAVSRAVRTPSRVEEDLLFTQPPDPMTGVFARLVGPGDFDSERITAFEAGLRVQPTERVFLDVAVFHNELEDLAGLEPGPPFLELMPPPPHLVVPLIFRNSVEGESHGLEVAATIDVNDAWRLQAHWSWLEIDLDAKPGSLDELLVMQEGQAPRHQVSVISHADVGAHWDIDAIVRWVDDLPADEIDDYLAAGVRFAWSPSDNLEVAIVVQELFSSHHREFNPVTIGSATGGSEVQRGIYGIVTWRH